MIARIYHHYETWEEYRCGMWRAMPAREAEELRPRLVVLITDDVRFLACMRRAMREWPISCEDKLSNAEINRAAWLWHAGACLELGAPEWVTRSIWTSLTPRQRAVADEIAWGAVHEWEAGREGAAVTQAELPLALEA